MIRPQWRALLFVPAGNNRFVKSAIRYRPDAVILDLEDGVAEDAKSVARNAVGDHLRELHDAGIDAILRVNAGILAMTKDLQAINGSPLAAVLVSKCTDGRGLQNAAELLNDLSGDSDRLSAPLIALIESPVALPKLADITREQWLIGLMFGSEDYAAELSVFSDSPAMDVPATLIAAACAARNLLAIGLAGSIANFSDLDAYAAKVAKSRALGFRAAAAIHPAQLPVLRAGFAPSEAEIAKARQVIATFEAAAAQKRGVAKLHGAMLDAPVVTQARNILKQASHLNR